MDVSEFRNDIVVNINNSDFDPEARRESFINLIVADLIDAGEAVGFEPCRYVGKGSNNRNVEIDGYHFDEDDSTLCIFVCKYTGGELANTLTKTEIERLLTPAKEFVKESFSGEIQAGCRNGDLAYGVAEYIGSKRDLIQRYRFYIITDDIQSSRMMKNLDVSLDDKPAQVSVFDIKTYFDLVNNSGNYESSEINLIDYGFEGLRCIKVGNEVSDPEYEAYLCIMPGKLLSDIYSKYGFHLLEANVRSYLSVRKKINRDMKKTITDEPGRFFAYNNGITATCTQLELSDDSDTPLIRKITSLQIVNGCQTMATINLAAEHDRRKCDVSKVFVPMKIMKVMSENSSEMTMKISNYSNSQNKLTDADFFSNSPFHIEIERLSKRLNAPAVNGSIVLTKWYYERARGSYLQDQAGMTPSQRKEFQSKHPKSQCITKTDLAKFRNTFDMKPHFVSQGTQKNMKEFAKVVQDQWDSTQPAGSYFTERYYKDSVAMAIIFKNLEKAVADNSLAPWYQGGYRANIVTYSIAKLVHELKSKNAALNYSVIWADQKSPDCLRDCLLDLCEKILGKITEPSHGDVREYCKKPDCWISVMNMAVDINFESLRPYLQSKTKEKYDARIARRDDSNNKKREDLAEVVGYGEEYWKAAIEWDKENQVLTYDERTVVKKGTDMRVGHLPSEKEAVFMLKALEKLKDAGFTSVNPE